MDTYRIVTKEADLLAIFNALKADDLLWTVYPEVDAEDWSFDLFLAFCGPGTVTWTLAGYVDGDLAGVLWLWPFRGALAGRCGEIGVTAFRKHFKDAERLVRGALEKACDELDVASIIGRIPCYSRHVLAMHSRLGFCRLGKVPGLMWYTRKRRPVDGWLVMATPESIRLANARAGFTRKTTEEEKEK